MHLAELNIGRLNAPVDDPRVHDFMANLDRVNGMGKRMPGFVWMMEGSGEPGTGNTENSIGDDPQFVANLTVWKMRIVCAILYGTRFTSSFTSAVPSGSSFWGSSIL